MAEDTGNNAGTSGDAGKGTSGDAGAGTGGDTGAGKGDAAQTFTQADLDRIVKERVQRERTKYADYDDLKKKAGASATAEEQIAALQKDLAETRRDALKRRVQATHGISDEDADLFLTGVDEESLTAQAKRLAERDKSIKATGNRVPREGRNPAAAATDEREFVRNLFGRAD